MTEWTCTRTGLSIVEGPVSMYRVSSVIRGALDPPARKKVPASQRRGWSRFDVPRYQVARGDAFDAGGRTIYGAERRDTPFTEALAWKMALAETYAGIIETARFTGESVHAVLADMQAMGIMTAAVTEDWVQSRGVYRVAVPAGTWIDLTHRDGIAAAKAAVGKVMDDVPFTRAHLEGDDRTLTTRVAEALRNVEVKAPAGSVCRPDGIRFESKFGVVAPDDVCWAIWGDNALQAAHEDHEGGMDAEDPDVQTAVRVTGVYVP